MKQGPFGWLALAVVLAIPAFLFYRWKSGMQSAQNMAIATIARSRIPQSNFFGKSPVSVKVNSPLDSSAPRPVAQASTRQNKTNPSMAAALPAPTGQPVPAPAPAALASKAPPSPESGEIVVTRDPTLSPGDFAELARLRQLALARRWRLLHPIKRKIYRPSVESTIHLMGIIYNPGNPMAIVNDLSLSVGGRVGEVRILKINKGSVVFAYKNKRFTRIISK